MWIADIFSKRQKRLRGEFPQKYQFDKLDRKFRNQVVLIIRDTIGDERYSNDQTYKAYKIIHRTLCKEYGVFSLDEKNNEGYYSSDIFSFFLKEQNIEKCLDVVELSFSIIDFFVRKYQNNFRGTSQNPDQAIDELRSHP